MGDATDPRARFGSVRFGSVRALTLAGTRKVSVGAGVRSVGRSARTGVRPFVRSVEKTAVEKAVEKAGRARRREQNAASTNRHPPIR